MLSSSKCSNYGDTENAAKAEGSVRKIQTQKCVTYLHFFEDLLLTLRKMCINNKEVTLTSIQEQEIKKEIRRSSKKCYRVF